MIAKLEQENRHFTMGKNIKRNTTFIIFLGVIYQNWSLNSFEPVQSKMDRTLAQIQTNWTLNPSEPRPSKVFPRKLNYLLTNLPEPFKNRLSLWVIFKLHFFQILKTAVYLTNLIVKNHIICVIISQWF